jgi:phospholipid/cholesterol/gamma-HCH transport system substrate-binding protein
MRSAKLEISVGAFVFAGFCALAFLALQVSGLNLSANNQKTYTIFARFSNASGLSERAKVSVAGVVVGRVAQVGLDPVDNRAKVTMVINSDVNFLTQDSIASIQTAGILGEKYIAISNGGAPDLLVDGGEITDTQSALVLEELIGKLLTSLASKKD